MLKKMKFVLCAFVLASMSFAQAENFDSQNLDESLSNSNYNHVAYEDQSCGRNYWGGFTPCASGLACVYVDYSTVCKRLVSSYNPTPVPGPAPVPPGPINGRRCVTHRDCKPTGPGPHPAVMRYCKKNPGEYYGTCGYQP